MRKRDMTHDEIIELLGAYGLDAVDADERATVEEHLPSCARCRAEVADHREVAAMLAHTGSDAPEGLWDRIVGSLDETPPPLDLASVTSIAERAAQRRLTPGWVPALVGAAAVLLVAVLGLQLRSQEQRIDELQIALSDPLTPAFDAALDDPSTRTFELTSTDGELRVRALITDDGQGYLRANALPELSPERTYQLWGAAGDELVSVGVLGHRPSIVSFRADRYGAFAITEEVAPGVVRSEAQPVVAGAAA